MNHGFTALFFEAARILALLALAFKARSGQKRRISLWFLIYNAKGGGGSSMRERNFLIAFFAVFGPVSAHAAASPVAVTGLISSRLQLGIAELGAFPAVHVSATQISGRGPVPLDCTGAALSAIIAKAGLNVGKANNAKLAHSVLVTADDGYAVSLSLGEIDPDYGNENAIIATQCNGQPMEAPRLVVPGDKHGGRAVNGVVSIEVK
jgi:hypothetical protein